MCRLPLPLREAAPVLMAQVHEDKWTVLLPAADRRAQKIQTLKRCVDLFTDLIASPLALALARSMATLELPINLLGLPLECGRKSGGTQGSMKRRHKEAQEANPQPSCCDCCYHYCTVGRSRDIVCLNVKFHPTGGSGDTPVEGDISAYS